MEAKTMENVNETRERTQKLHFRVVILCLIVLFLSGIYLSQHARADHISITVEPSVPKEGVPIVVRLSLNNPLQQNDLMDYALYGNDKLLSHGSTLLPPESTKQVVYVYPESPKQGERITFHVKTRSDLGNHEKTVNMPSYPPQVWSGFVSFAGFSVSLMGGSIGLLGESQGFLIPTIEFYSSNFIEDDNLNVGLIFSLVLIVLLVFLELSEPIETKGFRIMGLRIRFSKISLILFIAFTGMVVTKIVMILRWRISHKSTRG
jgi:hypothetical protein